MTSAKPDFFPFAWSLFLDVLRRPGHAVSQVESLDTRRCLHFAWLCLFVSTLASALVDLVMTGPLLDFLMTDPARYSEVAQQSGSLVPASFEEFVAQRELFQWVTVVKILFAPLTAWFFPYLIAGALFVLLSSLSLVKSGPGTYDRVIKVICIAQAPLLLCAIPIVGPIVGNIWCLIFVVRAVGSLFHVHYLGRLSATALCFFVLFSIWNSTVAQVATALKTRDWTWIK